MDSITHVLSAALWTEPFGAAKSGGRERWRERLAVAMAALLPDVDGLLGWVDRARDGGGVLYANFHRVFTHSVPGFVLAAVVAATLARWWPRRLTFARSRKGEKAPIAGPPSWQQLLGLASIAVFWHFVGDWVTAWGRLRLLWPLSRREFQLGWVNSIDPILLCLTIAAWAGQNVALGRGARRTAWGVAFLWLGLCGLYVVGRRYWGAPAFF